MLIHTDAHCSEAIPVSVPWDQVILACIEHMLDAMSPELMVGVALRGDHLQEVASKFHPPFEWQKAVAETALAKARQVRKKEEEIEGDLGRSKRRRSDSVVLQEPAKSRLRLSLGAAGSEWRTRDYHHHQHQQLVREGEALLSSLTAEATRSKG